jgi:hypothetical protein
MNDLQKLLEECPDLFVEAESDYADAAQWLAVHVVCVSDVEAAIRAEKELVSAIGREFASGTPRELVEAALYEALDGVMKRIRTISTEEKDNE